MEIVLTVTMLLYNDISACSAQHSLLHQSLELLGLFTNTLYMLLARLGHLCIFGYTSKLPFMHLGISGRHSPVFSKVADVILPCNFGLGTILARKVVL